MITLTQIKMARAALGLTQGDVAKLAGISTTAFNSIELGLSDPKTSTMTAIQSQREHAGAVFGRDGTVKLVAKAQRFVVGPWGDGDPEKRALALQIINAGRERAGLGPMVDPIEEDDQ